MTGAMCPSVQYKKHILAFRCAYQFVKLIHHVSASVLSTYIYVINVFAHVCLFFEVHGVITFDYEILVAISSSKEPSVPSCTSLPLFDHGLSGALGFQAGQRAPGSPG